MEHDELISVLASPVRERCAEFSLVLAAQGIDARISRDGSNWLLSVPRAAESAARYEIAAYSAEAGAAASRRPPPVLSRPGRPWLGVGAYLAVIVGIAVLASVMSLGFDWYARGRMDGALLRAGDWWRTLTALTLHADLAHLLGNAVFGSFFGYTVARYLGNGFGWFAIIVTGALGNLVNGFVSGADHRSIGASTAVFAALGLLSAYCWRAGFPAWATRRERLAPVVAGIGLLAFTGAGGENTDLGAHLFGFVCGFGGGLLIARYGVPAGRRAQLIAGLSGAGLIAAGWVAALI